MTNKKARTNPSRNNNRRRIPTNSKKGNVEPNGLTSDISVRTGWEGLIKEDFWSFLQQIFKLDAYTEREIENIERVSQPLWVKEGDKIVAAALYEIDDNLERTFLVLVGTSETHRNRGMLKEMITELKRMGKPIHLETAKHSFAHAVLFLMNFRQSTGEYKCASPIHVNTNCAYLHLDPSISPQSSLERESAPDEFGHFFSKNSPLNLYHDGKHVKKSADFNCESMGANKVGLEEIQRRMPWLVVLEADNFQGALGDELTAWLVFRLALLELKERGSRGVTSNKRTRKNEEEKWKDLKTQCRKDMFRSDTVLQLNKISNETGIMFVPLLYDADTGKFQGPEVKSDVGIEHIVPLIVCDSQDKPLFLCTFETILNERKRLLFGPQDPIRENDHLAAGLLLPERILRGQQRNLQWKGENDSCVQPKLQLDEEDFRNGMEQGRRLIKYGSKKFAGIINAVSIGINPSFMAVASGIAIQADGRKCCYTPTPEFNRRLDPERLRQMKESGMFEMFTKEAEVETQNQPYSLFPYSFGDTGVPLKDLSAEEEAKFAGRTKTVGLEKFSVERLYGCFFRTQTKELEAEIQKEIGTEDGRLIVLSILMEKICAAFCFKEKNDFKRFLCLLLGCAEKIPSWEDLHINSLGETVLLAKVLWVSLGFPVLAALEGSARLYCANMALLGVNFGSDYFLDSAIGTNGLMPEELYGCQASLHWCNIKGGLTKDNLLLLFEKSLSLQNNVGQARPIELSNLIPQLCESLAIEKEQQIFICRWKNGGRITKVIEKYQKQPLIQELKELQENNSTIGGLLVGLKPDLLVHCGPHTIRKKNSARVRFFGILLGIMKIDLDDDNIECTSPHVALKNFFITNGKYKRSREEDETFPWIPQGIPKANENDKFKILMSFKNAVVSPIVELLGSAFLGCLQQDGGDKSRYKVSEMFLIEWLYAYLWELVHWGGVNINFSGELTSLKMVRELLQPVTAEGNGEFATLTDCLKRSYGVDLKFNLFGVVTFVVSHIANRETSIREDGKTKEGQLSFVELFTTEIDEGEGIFEECMKKICPLFPVSGNNGKERKVSLFELTKWLFSSCSKEAQEAAKAVDEALAGHIEKNHFNLDALMSVVHGNGIKNSKLFQILLLPDSKKETLLAGKALVAFGEESPDGGWDQEELRRSNRVSKRTEVLGSMRHEVVVEGVKNANNNQRKIKLQRVGDQRLGQYDAFVGSVPNKLLRPVAKFFNSEEYRLKYKQNICTYNFDTLDANDEDDEDDHCAVYLSSAEQEDYGDCHKATIGLVGKIKEALKVQTKIDYQPIVEGTVENRGRQEHEIPHVELVEAFEEGNSGYLCYMPLGGEGCLLRLDYLTEEGLDGFRQDSNEPKTVRKGTLVLEKSKFVHIPFGAMVILDARQFLGVLYGSSTVKRFYCMFAENPKDGHVGEVAFVKAKNDNFVIPQFQTELQTISKFMNYCMQIQGVGENLSVLAMEESFDESAGSSLNEDEDTLSGDNGGIAKDHDAEGSDAGEVNTLNDMDGGNKNPQEKLATDEENKSHEEIEEEEIEEGLETRPQPSADGLSDQGSYMDEGMENSEMDDWNKESKENLALDQEDEFSYRGNFEAFIQGGTHDGKYKSWEEKESLAPRRFDMNGVESYFIDFLPPKLLAPVLQSDQKIFKDGTLDSEYEKYSQPAFANGYSTLEVNEFGDHHAVFVHYQPLQNGKGGPEEALVETVAGKMSDITGRKIKPTQWGSLFTVNGQYNQPCHTDHPDIYKSGKKALICFAPLNREGCWIRLDVPTKEVQEKCTKASDGDKISFLKYDRKDDEEPVLCAVRYLHIPYGAMVLLDAKQFHAGNYGSDKVRRFFCVLADFDFRETEKVRFLRSFLPLLETSGERILTTQKRYQEKSEKERGEYIEELEGYDVNGGRKRPSKSSSKTELATKQKEVLRGLYDKIAKMVGVGVEEISEAIKTLEVVRDSEQSQSPKPKRRKRNSNDIMEGKSMKTITKLEFDYFKVGQEEKDFHSASEGFCKFASGVISNRTQTSQKAGVIFGEKDRTQQQDIWRFNEVTFSHGNPNSPPETPQPNNVTNSLTAGSFMEKCYDEEASKPWKDMADALIMHRVVFNTSFSGTYHLGIRENKELSYFPPHQDKKGFDYIIFVALGGDFWTLLAVPNHTGVSVLLSGENGSQTEYEEWKGKLSKGNGEVVRDFEEKCKQKTTYEYRLVPFRNKPGTILKFPSRWVHGTLNRGGHGVPPKELLILAFI